MSNENQSGIVTLKGKRYATVALRVHVFRQTHTIEAGWGIVTDAKIAGTSVIVKASIVDREGRVLAEGTAYQSLEAKGKTAEATNPVEVAETSAVGRALAFAGYSGDADMGIASAEEVQAAERMQSDDEPERSATPPRQPRSRTTQPARGRPGAKSSGPVDKGPLVGESPEEQARVKAVRAALLAMQGEGWQPEAIAGAMAHCGLIKGQVPTAEQVESLLNYWEEGKAGVA